MNDELITNEKDEVEIDKNTEKSDDLITEIKEDGKVKPILTEEQIKSKKKKRRKVAVAAFVLILAVGAVGNWYYQNTDLSSTIEPLLHSTDTKTLGEAEYVDSQVTTQANSESTYFSKARVDRQTARDSSIEKLQAVVDSKEAGADAKKAAEESISRISKYVAIENIIETLVTAKGINNCLAVINDDGTKVDVIVDVKDLSDNVIIQIKEIAMEQLNCSFEDITIIQSNNS